MLNARNLPTVVLLLLVTACGSDDPGPGYVPAPLSNDSGIKWDGGGFNWTDLGSYQQDGWVAPQADQWMPPADQGAGPSTDAGTPDTNNNTNPNCKAPAGAKCSPACGADQVCADAQGGTCVKVVELVGGASDKEVLKTVALAYIDCWQRQPSSDTLCVAFDTCKMTGTVTAAMVEDWVCNMAQVTDFPSSGKHDKAQDLCGCSWYGYDRADWQLSSVGAGEQAAACMSYDVNAWLYYDHLNVDLCKQFPPS